MAAYRWKTFYDDDDRPEKPRRYGLTELRGPHHSLYSTALLTDLLSSMSHFVDGLSLPTTDSMPKTRIKQLTDLAHHHNVYVSSTGDVARRRGSPSGFKEYVEECKELGFDTVEVDGAGITEETMLRYVRFIKSRGLRAKPHVSVKFDKSDVAFSGDRAFGAYVMPLPQSSEMVEDVDLLVRRAERCLEAGADMIMIDADDLCRQADSLRTDMIAKIVGRLGLEKIMFEASHPKISEWFIKCYGPKVNLYVDHSQVMDLECLRGRHHGQNSSSLLGKSYFLL